MRIAGVRSTWCQTVAGLAVALSLVSLGVVPAAAQTVLDWGFEALNAEPPEVNDGSTSGNDGTLEAPADPDVAAHHISDGSGPFSSNYLDFVGGWINHGNDASLDMTGDYTLSLWFEGHSAGANAVMAGRYNDGGAPGFGLWFLGTEQPVFAHFAGGIFNWVVSPTAYTSGWHHAAGVFEVGTGSTLYIDGAPVASGSDATSGISSFAQDFFIGAQQHTLPRPFDGGLDEVKLFPAALGLTQIQDLFNSNTLPGTPAPVLDVSFETINPGPPQVPDNSAQGNHGTASAPIVDPGVTPPAVTLIDDGSGPFGSNYLNFSGGAVNGGSDSSLDLTGSYSVSAWFQAHDVNESTEVIAGRYNDGADEGFLLRIFGHTRPDLSHRNNHIEFGHTASDGLGGLQFVELSAEIPGELDGSWHHAVGVFEEGVGATMYVDGSPADSSTAVTDTITAYVTDFLVGAQQFTAQRPFYGGIDEVKLYDFALSGTQVSSLYTTNSIGDSIPGDLDGDGFVGGNDLDIVRSFWGQFVTAGNKLHGDPSGDGFVGGDDLDEVRAHWGEGTPPAAEVPEPGLFVLLLSGLVAGVLHRRLKR